MNESIRKPSSFNRTRNHTHIHLALASTEIEQEIQPELRKRLQLQHHVTLLLPLAVFFRRRWELSKSVRVSVRRLFQPVLPIEHVSILQQFVQQDQQNIRLPSGHCPSGGAQFRSAAQETLHHRYVSTSDRSVQRSHSVEIDVLHRCSFLEQQLHQLRIALGRY